MEPGDYIKLTGGPWVENVGKPLWVCKTPNGHVGNLQVHTIKEEADGTITVTPSILISGHREGDPPGQISELWHGHLKAGVWEAC